ncbi:MAG: hypothetical protein N2Z75_10785 [Meiothermus sp.]|nr:hypothetical protein [Meiothermus sp.]
MSRWMQVLVIFGVLVVGFMGGWLGYQLGAYSGRNAVINDIRGEAQYIRDRARTGQAEAKDFCRAYRGLTGELSGEHLARALQPLRDCN